jgi:eukaryotic-like serine/threonine-protein kinase
VDHAVIGGSAEFRGTRRFTVLRSLGAGGMGAVYEVLDTERDEHVALKTLRRADGQLLYRLKTEFRALSSLHHPNLVRLGELVEAGGQWFFTMELLDGHDFLAWVRPGGAVPETDSTLAAPAQPMPRMVNAETLTALSTPGAGGSPMAAGSYPELPLGRCDHDRLRHALVGVARGLIALHDAGLVHRDVKPSNLLVTAARRVVLLDFGLVRTAGGGAAAEEGQVMGTPAYMAPEQISASLTTAASDCYAVGVMMYQAMTGRLPFTGTPIQMFAAKNRARPVLDGADDAPEELRALCLDLLDPDPKQRPDGRTVLERLGASVEPTSQIRTLDGILLGRDVERSELDRAFATTGGGGAVVCYVTGRSGMGKTALVDDFLDELAERDDVVVLRGRCYERESVPYKALDSVIDDLALHLRALHRYEVDLLVPDNAAALAQVFPVLGQVPAIAAAPPERGRDPARVRTRALECLRELLTRIATGRRLVIAIDDLHWGDSDSAAVLAELLGPPAPPPVLLIGTYRSEGDPGPIVAGLVHRPGGAEIRTVAIEPLTASQAMELAEHLLGGRDGAHAMAESVASESGGSPFFVGEMVRYLRATGAATPAPSLEHVIESRIAQLPDDARRLLEVVALVGQPLAQGLAARAADVSLDAALANLRAAHLLRSHGARERDLVETYHDRIRETVVAGLGDREHEVRQSLATALIETEWADPDQLGIDFLAAVDAGRARQAAIAAAERAAAALAFDRAAALYQLSIGMIEDPVERCRLLRARADALAYAGRGEEAAHDYLAVAAGAVGDDRLELERYAADNLLRSGHIVDGVAHLSRVLVALGARVPTRRAPALVNLVWSRARLSLRGLDFRRRTEADLPARDLARVDALFGAASTFAMIDHLRGAAVQTDHLLRALSLGEERRVCRALLTEIGFLAAQGGRGLRRAEALLRRVQGMTERLRDPYLAAGAQLGAGLIAFLSGRYRVAVDALREAERGLSTEVVGAWWERTMARYFLCLAQINAGELAALGRTLAEAVAEAERKRDVFARNLFASHPTVWRALADDRTAGIEEGVVASLEGWPTNVYYQAHHVAVIARAMVRLYDGDAAGAAALLDESMPMVRSLMIQRLPFVMGEVHKLRGQAALRLGDRRGVEDAARGMDRIGLAVGTAFCASFRAATALGHGDADAATRDLGVAVDGFVESGSLHDAAACRWRLGEVQGGARGERLVGDAKAWFAEQGVAAPERMVDFLAPRWRG